MLSLKDPVVMGIININQDSFFAASRHTAMDDILTKVDKMLREGAAIIDFGAMSSRPGAVISDADTEIDILAPVIQQVSKVFPQAIISVDTLHSRVAAKVIGEGASIINDISAGDYDPLMMTVIGSCNIPYIMMHMQGTPPDMQNQPQYKDVTTDILSYFVKKVHQSRQAGIKEIVIDPGFGFGKTIDQNFELLRHLETFRLFDIPLLAGLSRKSIIWKTLQTDADGALNGTTALHMVALQKGVSILRVHDVKEAVECITLYKKCTSKDIS